MQQHLGGDRSWSCNLELESGALRKLLLASLLLVAPAARANIVYISQSGGAFSGGSACNGQTTQSASYFNTSSNWTDGAPTGNQIGPGTLVYLCGTFTFSAGTTGLKANTVLYGSSSSPRAIPPNGSAGDARARCRLGSSTSLRRVHRVRTNLKTRRSVGCSN